MTMLVHTQTIGTWEDLYNYVEEQQGVVTVSMQFLREVSGYGRLGSAVRLEILEQLKAHGLCIVRDELPNTQDSTVILYCCDSRAGRTVEAVLNARMGQNLEEAAEVLSQLNDSQDPSNIKVEIFEALSHLDTVAERAKEALSE